MAINDRESSDRGTVRTRVRIVEATVAELRDALDAGVVTSVELVAAYLNRIAYYDRHGIRLNAVPVLNPDLFSMRAPPTSAGLVVRTQALSTGSPTRRRTATRSRD